MIPFAADGLDVTDGELAFSARGAGAVLTWRRP